MILRVGRIGGAGGKMRMLSSVGVSAILGRGVEVVVVVGCGLSIFCCKVLFRVSRLVLNSAINLRVVS